MAHLLLIDDDPDLVPEQVRHAFPAPGHRVEVAATGKAGLERVRTAIRFPLSEPVPVTLIERIAKFRAKEIVAPEKPKP